MVLLSAVAAAFWGPLGIFGGVVTFYATGQWAFWRMLFCIILCGLSCYGAMNVGIVALLLLLGLRRSRVESERAAREVLMYRFVENRGNAG